MAIAAIQLITVRIWALNDKMYLQTPAKNPYNIANGMTLPTPDSPIIPKIKTEHPRDANVIILMTPIVWINGPGARRPIKLQAFKMTSYAFW